MKQCTFGRSGMQVSEVGFGAWGIGSRHYGPVDEQDAFGALAAYLEGGGSFIDTARGYHHSEDIIGRFLKQEDARDRVVLCSKTPKLDEEEIREDLDVSLRLLQTDCIDLYYLHAPPDDPAVMDRVLDVFSTLKDEGKIRAVGASIKGPNVDQAVYDLHLQYIRTGRVDAIQLIFSILRQGSRVVFDEAAAAGVALVGRTVLENGFLTGRYRPGHRFSGASEDHRVRWDGEQLDRILTVAADLEQDLVAPPYESLAQVALRFALDEPGLTTVIPGAKNAAQTQANLAAAALPPLPEDIREVLAQQFAGEDELVNLAR